MPSPASTGPASAGQTAAQPSVRAPQHAELADDALVAGLVVEDPDAATEFVRRFQAKVYGLALAVTRDPALADDVAQESFLRAWRAAATYDTRRGSVTAWLLTITRHAGIDAVRARRQVPADAEQLDTLLHATLGGDDTGESATSRSRRGGHWNACARCPGIRREPWRWPCSAGARQPRSATRVAAVAAMAAALVLVAVGATILRGGRDAPADLESAGALAPLRSTDGGDAVGNVSLQQLDGRDVMVVAIVGAPAGVSYACRLHLSDGRVVDTEPWPPAEGAWVVDVPAGAARDVERVALVVAGTDDVWSTATFPA